MPSQSASSGHPTRSHLLSHTPCHPLTIIQVLKPVADTLIASLATQPYGAFAESPPPDVAALLNAVEFFCSVLKQTDSTPPNKSSALHVLLLLLLKAGILAVTLRVAAALYALRDEGLVNNLFSSHPDLWPSLASLTFLRPEAAIPTIDFSNGTPPLPPQISS